MKSIYKNIDNDITYLLSQIGHNVTIENLQAKAIINNTDMERGFDDKRAITNSNLKRGNYVNYNSLNFITLSEITDKMHNTYNKGIIRACNYDVKFIIKGYLFIFHCIVEKETGQIISKSDIVTMGTDRIIVTLPLTSSSKLIDLNDRFLSMDRAWEIENIDRTAKGLIKLTCKSSLINPSLDDVKKEIADIDKLIDKTQAPVYPFDVQPDIVNPVEPEIPIEPEIPTPANLVITGDVEFTVWDEDILYTVNTSEPVKWTLSSQNVIKFGTPAIDNKCYLSPVNDSDIGSATLKVELVSDASQFAEKYIQLFY